MLALDEIDVDLGEVSRAIQGTNIALELILDDGRWGVRDNSWGEGVMMPISEWRQQVRVFTLDASPLEAAIYSQEQIRAFLQAHLVDLETIRAGHDTDWNGSNYVGVYTTAEAAEAAERLVDAAHNHLFGNEAIELWEAAEWLQSTDAEDLFRHTPDEWVKLAREEDVLFANGADEVQRYCDEERERLADEKEEADSPLTPCA